MDQPLHRQQVASGNSGPQVLRGSAGQRLGRGPCPPERLPDEKKVNVSVGEYIEAVGARSLFTPKTFQSYAQALRKIVGDITGTGGREKRDAVKLRALTPEKIEDWRIDFIRRKVNGPLEGEERPDLGEQLPPAGPGALQRRDGRAGSRHRGDPGADAV